MSDIPELTKDDFSRAMSASLRKRLMRGQFESGPCSRYIVFIAPLFVDHRYPLAYYSDVEEPNDSRRKTCKAFDVQY